MFKKQKTQWSGSNFKAPTIALNSCLTQWYCFMKKFLSKFVLF